VDDSTIFAMANSFKQVKHPVGAEGATTLIVSIELAAAGNTDMTF
jgi:hypothetical protein